MLITAIERDKKNKDWLLVYIDNQRKFTIAEEDYLRLNLYEMREITEDEIMHIKQVVNFNAAKSKAVKYLALKLHSEGEVRKKLDCFDDETIDEVIEELKSVGYINDKVYAEKYVSDRSKLKPKAKSLLKLELQSRGVACDIIDIVLNELEVDEPEVALGLVRKRFGKYNIEDDKVVKKIYSFLLNRGYSFDIVDNVLNRIKSGE